MKENMPLLANSSDFLYIVNVKMYITGCKLEFQVKDKDLLQLISNDSSIIQNLSFYSNKDKVSTLNCKIATKDLMKTYAYINFVLKSRIIKILVITSGIKDLNVEDNIDCTIENEKEAFEKGLVIIPYDSKFASLGINAPVIQEKEFKNNMSMLNDSRNIYENVFFWLYISYSVADINKGKTNFDHISQYILLWTAFNALYSKLYPSLGDKKSVEKFAKMKYVIDYFEEVSNQYHTYEQLKQLSTANLTLRDKTNVSQELKKSLADRDNNAIALSAMLCLYAIRNAIIHGSAVKEIDLCRTAFEVLNPLIKISLFNEISHNKNNGQN